MTLRQWLDGNRMERQWNSAGAWFVWTLALGLLAAIFVFCWLVTLLLPFALATFVDGLLIGAILGYTVCELRDWREIDDEQETQENDNG
jgi:hypothetical protein